MGLFIVKALVKRFVSDSTDKNFDFELFENSKMFKGTKEAAEALAASWGVEVLAQMAKVEAINAATFDSKFNKNPKAPKVECPQVELKLVTEVIRK